MIGRRQKRKLNKIIAAVAVLLVIAVILPCAAYSISFARYDEDVVFDYAANGAAVYSFESDGDTLGGALFEAQGSDTLIVFAPGYHAGLNGYYPIINHFSEKGYSVFYFDPLGCGMSGGKCGEGFSREVTDLESALDFAKENKYFGCRKVVLFGHSRGGYAVCCALRDRDDIDAVISVSGINSAMEGIIHPVKNKISVAAYIGWPALWLYNTVLFGEEVTDARCDDILNSTETHTLIVHGLSDETVPLYDDAIFAYKPVVNSPFVKFITVDTPGRDGHTGVLFDDDGTANDELMKQITDFLSENIYWR